MNEINKPAIKQLFFLFLYYGFFRYWPVSYFPILGKLSKACRAFCCRRIFAYCGQDVNIERKAFFGLGLNICIGNRSTLGINCYVPDDIIIGNNVMMGPNCYILYKNHRFDRTDIPMIDQNYTPRCQTVIDNDVWIGRDVCFTPGRKVADGTVIGARTLLCKDFPPYSIIGGNPARLLKNRRN